MAFRPLQDDKIEGEISEGAEVKTSVEIYIKKITINHIRTNGAHESISTPVAGGKC
jgi:hypothetical protein